MAETLTLVTSTRPGLRQGAVYAAAPIFWVPEDVFILRPAGSRDRASLSIHSWHEVSDRFRSGDNVEQVVVHAKLRPVVVVSHDYDLRGSDAIRVVPLYSYHPGSFADRERSDIEAGTVPHALHVRQARDLREGYVNLREAALLPRAFLDDRDHIGDLDKLSLATLIRHYAAYIAA